MNINVVGARRRDVENMRRLGIMLHEILGGNSKYMKRWLYKIVDLQCRYNGLGNAYMNIC